MNYLKQAIHQTRRCNDNPLTTLQILQFMKERLDFSKNNRFNKSKFEYEDDHYF